MPTTNKVIEKIGEANPFFSLGNTANTGAFAVSCLEMKQNIIRLALGPRRIRRTLKKY